MKEEDKDMQGNQILLLWDDQIKLHCEKQVQIGEIHFIRDTYMKDTFFFVTTDDLRFL